MPSLPVTETDGVVGLDPAFSDAGGGDYRIAGGSAAGAGFVPAAIDADADGRCYGPSPAIGA